MASTGQLTLQNLQRLRASGVLPDTERMTSGLDRGSKNIIRNYSKTNKTKIPIVPTDIRDVRKIRTDLVKPALHIPGWSDKSPLSAVVRRHEVDELRNSKLAMGALDKHLTSKGLNKFYYEPGEKEMLAAKMQMHMITDKGGHASNRVIASEIDNLRKLKNYSGYDMGSDKSPTAKKLLKGREAFKTYTSFGSDAQSQPIKELNKRANKLDAKTIETLDRRLKAKMPFIDDDFKLIYRSYKKQIWTILITTGVSVAAIIAYLKYKMNQRKKQTVNTTDDNSKGDK